MCGIAGVVPLREAEPIDEDRLRAMCDTLQHRGPDDEGIDIHKGAALGMRRLSIIDVAGGQQPLCNEDRAIRAVYNGEIYNFRGLRDRLAAQGHRFASATDGEVIPHLWEEYGPEFPKHLNGMFAIALHDANQDRFVLVRDRVGIKPLFYALTSTHLVFGSEIKAILASGLIDRQLDMDGLGQFLAWEYVPAPGTLLQDVRKLEPGTLLDVNLKTGEIAQRDWWDFPHCSAPHPDTLSALSDDDWVETVDGKLRECVQRRLVSDVPLGAFLSGGVDSSLVVAGMGEARTFSIGFDDPTYNELDWSKRAAEHLGVHHRVEVIRPDVVELFEHLMQYMDDPIGDFSIFPTYLVSRLAREEVTVALSGDGGDELFGGYETYVAQDKARMWAKLPTVLRKGIAEPLIDRLKPSPAKKGLVNKAKRFVEGLQHDTALGHARWRLFAGEAIRRELFTPEALAQLRTPVEEHILRLAETVRDRDELHRALYVDFKSYLVDNCLVKVDRMSMACSL